MKAKVDYQKYFLGSSFFLPLGFSAGVTLDYYFGNQNYVSTINFDDPRYISTKYENIRRSTGFGTTLGLISSNLAREFRIGGISDLRDWFFVTIMLVILILILFLHKHRFF